MQPLADAARKVETAPPAELAPRLRDLITLMRSELARQDIDVLTILIVSTDTDLCRRLGTALEQRGRQITLCESTHQALHIVAARKISLIVLDFMLPGQDGRNLVVELRSRPATAAMPIVAVGPRRPEGKADTMLVQDVDRYFEKPVDPVEVADSVTLSLKRGHETSLEARRDPVSGLLNRAALCDDYTRLTARNVSANDPVAFALFGISRFEAIAQECGAAARDDFIRQIGAIFSSAFRTTDIIARWGFSEFVVLLPGEDHYGATRALEKVLPLLNGQRLVTPGGKVFPVTICAGLAIVSEKTPIEDSAEKAEQFLYDAFYACANNLGDQRLFSDANQSKQRSVRIAVSLADANMGRAIKQLLEREKYEVRLIGLVDNASEILARERFHLLILDSDLPSEEGFQILEQVKGIPHLDRLRVIMLVSNETAIVRALELGANDYAVKPLAITSFMTRVRRTLWHERPHSGTCLTVMILDHEIPQLLVAGTSLYQRCGCRVLLANDTDDALQRLAEIPPDFLILDMERPGMSGRAFIEQLPPLKDLEIIPAASPSGWDGSLVSDTFRIRGRLTRPYKPATLIEEFRTLIALDNDLNAGQANPEPIEAEIQRLLTRQY